MPDNRRTWPANEPGEPTAYGTSLPTCVLTSASSSGDNGTRRIRFDLVCDTSMNQ